MKSETPVSFSLLLCVSQTACEKTFSVMHHVIQRTISYAHGKHFEQQTEEKRLN